jgi:hypothetical protein
LICKIKSFIAAYTGANTYKVLERLLYFFYNSIGPVIAVILLCGFLVYMSSLIMSGHLNLGLKFIPFVDIYPLEIDQTYVSGFLFNSFIVTLTNFALINLISQIYSNFSANSAFNLYFKNISENTLLFRWASESKFFLYLSFAMFFLVIAGFVVIWVLKKVFGTIFFCFKKKEPKKQGGDYMTEMVEIKPLAKNN